MSLILFDQNVPIGLRPLLTGHDVKTAYEMGWAALLNGKLLDAAQIAGFDVMVTADQNLEYQQNLAGRRIALVVLDTKQWLTIKVDPSGVVAACSGTQEGLYVVVRFPKPPRLRRSPPPFNPGAAGGD